MVPGPRTIPIPSIDCQNTTGTIYLGQSLRFSLPVKAGDTLTVKLEVIEKKDKRRVVTLDCKVYNQHGKLVVSGTADVMAPADKMTVQRPALPEVRVLG